MKRTVIITNQWQSRLVLNQIEGFHSLEGTGFPDFSDLAELYFESETT